MKKSISAKLVSQLALGVITALAFTNCASVEVPAAITEEAAIVAGFNSQSGLGAADYYGNVNITVPGFVRSESVLHDVKNDVYLVSNIVGNPPTAIDNNGFISRVSPNGQILNLKWIESGVGGVTLNSPKGMTIANGVLYVADVNLLRKFNAKTGAPLGAIAPELDAARPAKFLNDVTSDCYGNVYVTDIGFQVEPVTGFGESGRDAIYKISPRGQVSIVAQGNALLHHPNGIDVLPNGKLLVANYDPFMGNKDLFVIDQQGNKSAFATLPTGLLDGVVILKTGVLVTSWNGFSDATNKFGKVYFVKFNGGAITELYSGLENPADIGYDFKRNRLLLPELPEPDNRGTVYIRSFNQYQY